MWRYCCWYRWGNGGWGRKPIYMEGRPIKQALETCKANMFIICLMTDLRFHCFISQQAPKGGPGLPTGIQVEEQATLWISGKIQSCGPSSPSSAGPHLKFLSVPIRTQQAQLSWLGRGYNALPPEVGLWVFLDTDGKCLYRRAHWMPFLKKAFLYLLSVESGDWVFSQGVYQTLSFPSVTYLPRNYFGNLGCISFLSFFSKNCTKHNPHSPYTHWYTLSTLLLQTVFVRKSPSLTWRPINPENFLKKKKNKTVRQFSGIFVTMGSIPVIRLKGEGREGGAQIVVKWLRTCLVQCSRKSFPHKLLFFSLYLGQKEKGLYFWWGQ